jgi:hypothetical protein
MGDSEYAVQNTAFPEGRAIHARAELRTSRDTSPPWVKLNSRRSRWSLKQLLIGGAALLSLAAAAGYGNYYWTTGRFLVSTDDASDQAALVYSQQDFQRYTQLAKDGWAPCSGPSKCRPTFARRVLRYNTTPRL